MLKIEKKEIMLNINNLSVEYHSQFEIVQAVINLDLKIKKGEVLGLVGETGAGKTTIGLAIMGLIPKPPGIIVSGSIEFFGLDLIKLTEKKMNDIRGKEISMIFQDPMTSLNPVMTIEKQISETIKFHEKLSESQAIKRAHEMLELVGIPKERGKEYPHQFSGGMRQRVVIAIAISCSPKLLIADEPTTALDVTIQAQVLELMDKLQNEFQSSMLMITHDLGVVAETCNTVSIIYAGHVIEHGTLVDVFENMRHPYTEGLFNSLPDLSNRAEKLKPIRGLIVDPSNLPIGCPFFPRCDYAMAICKMKKPDRIFRNSEHYVECHLYNEVTIRKGMLNIYD